jgi:2'-5' RNA ligase
MRLFAAVEIPKSVKEQLLPLCAGLPGARWVTADQMHVTLRFFGELDGALAEAVAEGLAAIRAPTFSLSLSGIGHFGNGRRVRVLWAGLDPEPALEVLQGKVEQAARRGGLDLEGRKFHAHVTLARFKGGSPNLAGFLAHHEPFRSETFPVQEFVLYSSHLSAAGAIYRREARFPLADPASGAEA